LGSGTKFSGIDRCVLAFDRSLPDSTANFIVEIVDPEHRRSEFDFVQVTLDADLRVVLVVAEEDWKAFETASRSLYRSVGKTVVV
jgi:hypothetical protein